MKVIAHRGNHVVVGENTLKSFSNALRAGVDGIELDVQLTLDRIPVVIHDARVDRTTNGRGWVSRASFRELETLDAGNGEHIPSLFQALSLIGSKAHAYIELKNGVGGNELLVVQSVLDAKQIETVTFISFDHSAIDRIKDLGLKCTLGYSYGFFIPDLNELNNIEVIVPRHNFVTKNLVSLAHSRGIEVIAWTVDDVKKAVALERIGVDGIITNDSEKMINALRQ
ncbi:MAG: glycerophosphodiester phosphodiesterase [Candidatus Micrarchaeaceae archaeon]